jgi:hypothetical protein
MCTQLRLGSASILIRGGRGRVPWRYPQETQWNDPDIVRLVAKVKKEVPIERAYNFSFAAQSG